jgi:hypothetical protein
MSLSSPCQMPCQNSPSTQVTLKLLMSSSDAGSMGNQQGPDSRGSRRQRLSRTRAKGPQVLMPPSQSSDPVDRPRLRAPAHRTSFNPRSKEIPVQGNSGAPVSFDVSQGDLRRTLGTSRLCELWSARTRTRHRASSLHGCGTKQGESPGVDRSSYQRSRSDSPRGVHIQSRGRRIRARTPAGLP